jgi:hypothetical protein
MVNPKPHAPFLAGQALKNQSAVDIKQADPDIIIFNEEVVSPELLLELQYEDISGKELINISRSDIVDGQNVIYSPIKNLSALRKKYNPNNIIASSLEYESLFARFAIDLIKRGAGQPYFDDNGDLVIEFDLILDGETIEVEIDATGTINRVDFS